MRRRLSRAAVATVAGAVAVGAAGTAYAAMSSPGPAYRLATATVADVTATLQAVGTVTPARQADVAFPLAGSVARVAVRTGQHVSAGKVLGALDTTSLRARLTSAKSTLASANAKVDSDIASQNAARSPSQQQTPSIAKLQQAVLAAQRKVDGALSQAKAALAVAEQACAPAPASASTSTGGAEPTQASLPSCADAEQQALAAETALIKAQQALSVDLTKLAKALSAPAAGGGRTAGGGAAATADQLAADQAAADAAAAQVAVARQNLAAARAVSPISGTVTTVAVAKGGSATAGSTAFVVSGLGAYQVVAQVAVADMPKIKVGQRATVLPDGVATPISGSVASIGLAPSASGSSVTYPIAISLDGPASGLRAGINADVAITQAHASGVTVPTSAVHTLGQLSTVSVYAGGKTQITRVTVGTMGPVLTQITSGLKAGQQVVLADLNQPLPSNSLFGRGGAFVGGFAGRGPGIGRIVRGG